MNNFSAVGRIGRDAVVRYTQAGKPVTGWALAVDKGWGDNKQTVWLDCTLWGERGVKVAEHIKKGDRLGVSGEIGTREHDGKTYVTLDVKEVTLLAAKQEGQGGGTPRQNAPRPTQRPVNATSPATSDDFDSDEIPFATNRSHY